MPAAFGEAHEPECLGRPLPCIPLGHTAHQQRELHVLDRGEDGDQVVELEDEAHAAGPVVGPPTVAHVTQRNPFDEHVAVVDGVEAGEAVQQGGLAAPAWPHDPQHLASCDHEVHSLEHLHLDGAEVVGLVQIPGLDDCVGGARMAVVGHAPSRPPSSLRQQGLRSHHVPRVARPHINGTFGPAKARRERIFGADPHDRGFDRCRPTHTRRPVAESTPASRSPLRISGDERGACHRTGPGSSRKSHRGPSHPALDGRPRGDEQASGRAGGDQRELHIGRRWWADMLRTMLGYASHAGIEARWLVVEGDSEFFAVTKRLHAPLRVARRRWAARRRSAQALPSGPECQRRRLRPGDPPRRCRRPPRPQTAGLAAVACPWGPTVIWRCHVGVDEPNEHSDLAWRFLRPTSSTIATPTCSREALRPLLGARRSHAGDRTRDRPDRTEAHCSRRRRRGEHPHPHGTPGRTSGRDWIRRSTALGVASSGGAMSSGRGRRPPPGTPWVAQLSRWDAVKDKAG